MLGKLENIQVKTLVELIQTLGYKAESAEMDLDLADKAAKHLKANTEERLTKLLDELLESYTELHNAKKNAAKYKKRYLRLKARLNTP